MTINPRTGKFSWAIDDPGPPERVYNETNRLYAYIPHDMVGFYSGPASYTAMRDPSRQASWGGTVGWSGSKPVMWQHYPIWGCPWTSSSYYWNTRGWTTETVREDSIPNLTPAPPISPGLRKIHERVVADIEDYTGKPFVRDPSVGLAANANRRLILEHTEVHPQGARGTGCPHGRMRPLYEALKGERIDDDMTPAEREEMNQLQAKVSQLNEQLYRVQRTTFGNGTLVTVTDSNRSVLKTVTGKDYETGDAITLQGDDALEFAYKMGLSLHMAVAKLTDSMHNLTQLDREAGDADVSHILRTLADAYDATQ